MSSVLPLAGQHRSVRTSAHRYRLRNSRYLLLMRRTFPALETMEASGSLRAFKRPRQVASGLDDAPLQLLALPHFRPATVHSVFDAPSHARLLHHVDTHARRLSRHLLPHISVRVQDALLDVFGPAGHGDEAWCLLSLRGYRRCRLSARQGVQESVARKVRPLATPGDEVLGNGIEEPALVAISDTLPRRCTET